MEPVSRGPCLRSESRKETTSSPRRRRRSSRPPISSRNTHLIKHFSSLVISILYPYAYPSRLKLKRVTLFQASLVHYHYSHSLGILAGGKYDVKSRKQALLKGRRRKREGNSRRLRLFPPITSWFRGTVHPHARLNSQKAGEDSLLLLLLLSEGGRGRTSLLRTSSRRVNVHRRMARENEPERRRARGPLLN